MILPPVFTIQTPLDSFHVSSTVSAPKALGGAVTNFCGGSNETLGNRKRTAASVPTPPAVANAAQAWNAVLKMPRRVTFIGARPSFGARRSTCLAVFEPSSTGKS